MKIKGRWIYKGIWMLVAMLVVSVNLYGQEKFAVKNPEGCTFIYSVLPYPEGEKFNSVLNDIPQPVCLEGPEDKIYKYSQMTIPGEVTWKGKKYRVKCIQGFSFRRLKTNTLKRIVISEGTDSVGQSCFENIQSLERVTLPGSLRNISYKMFAGCTNLKEVIIPTDAHLETIERFAFMDCSQLTYFNIPERVVNIELGPWRNCTMLSSINVATKNKNFESWDGVLYTKGRKLLIQYPIGKTEDIFAVPENVEEIGNSAFWGGKFLKTIYTPLCLKSIQHIAFKNCMALTDIYLPDGLTFIGNGAFWGCKNLEKVIINNRTRYTIESSISDSYNTFMPTTQVNRVEQVPDYSADYQRLINAGKGFGVNIHALRLTKMQQLVMDLSASVDRREDNNGRPCALLRVMIPVSGCVFSGNVIGKTDFKVNEYWVYLSEHSRYLKIQVPGCESLMLDFKELGFSDGVKSLCTYELQFEMK